MIHAQNLGESENSTMYDNCLKHHDLSNQELGSPDSFLPLSEPPDITNWFSSYKYESLVLETNDNFGFSYHEDSSTGNIVEAVESSREFITSEEKNCMMKKRSSSMLIKCKEGNKCESQVEKLDYPDLPLLSSEDPFIEKENWLLSNAYESPEVDRLLGHRHKQSMLDKEIEAGCNGKVENGKNLCLPDDLICNKTLEEESDGSAKDNVHELSTQNVNSFENGDVKVPSCTNEWQGGGSDSGFVSIMKSKRENNENSVMTCGKNHLLKDEKRAVRRKTLADRTNIQQQSYSGEMITGKWKCPQKSKPEIRPPLKQLRLGQWFHHV